MNTIMDTTEFFCPLAKGSFSLYNLSFKINTIFTRMIHNNNNCLFKISWYSKELD